MHKLLVYIATPGGEPKRASLEILSHVSRLARETSSEVVACLLGTNMDSSAKKVSTYGADRVLCVENPLFDGHINAHLLAGLEFAIDACQPTHMFFASSETVKDILGALAVRKSAAVLPDVVSFSIKDGGATAVRPVMAAKNLATVEATSSLVFVSVRSGSFESVEDPKNATVETHNCEIESSSRIPQLVEIVQAMSSTVDLSEARVVVAAGRGVRDQEGKKIVEELAGLFNGAIGASRAVVETDLFPATAQIGQTGKVVSPDLYFALGISGAIQHVAGMSNSRVIVAINKDADAPIFDYATYGIVGDLYKIVPLLIMELKKRGLHL